MTRSHWQANEYMKMSKLTQADVDRQKAAIDAHDERIRSYKRKERLCILGVCLGWVAIGAYMAYAIWRDGA